MLIGVAGKPVARQESQPLWRCVQMGAYHTTELELGRKFTLIKSCWDHIYLERLKIATDPAQDVGSVPLHWYFSIIAALRFAFTHTHTHTTPG